jgi:hypothetical protein
MNDDAYAKHQRGLLHNAPKAPPRQPQPGEEVWRLTHPKGRVQSCELRDNSRSGRMGLHAARTR